MVFCKSKTSPSIYLVVMIVKRSCMYDTSSVSASLHNRYALRVQITKGENIIYKLDYKLHLFAH